MTTRRKTAADKTTKKFSMEDAKAIAAELGIDWEKSSFDLNQFCCGLNVELEHGSRNSLTNVTNDDPKKTGEIALAHLNEIPDYYDRLAKMEAAGKSEVKTSSVIHKPQYIQVKGKTYRRVEHPRFIKVAGKVYEFVRTAIQGHERTTEEVMVDIKGRIDIIKGQIPSLDASYNQLSTFVAGKGDAGVTNIDALSKLLKDAESVKSQIITLAIDIGKFDDTVTIPDKPLEDTALNEEPKLTDSDKPKDKKSDKEEK